MTELDLNSMGEAFPEIGILYDELIAAEMPHDKATIANIGLIGLAREVDTATTETEAQLYRELWGAADKCLDYIERCEGDSWLSFGDDPETRLAVAKTLIHASRPRQSLGQKLFG